MRPDENGDTVFTSTTQELRRSGSDLAVRVFIHADARCGDALRLLARIGESAAALLRQGGSEETVGEIHRRDREQSSLQLTALLDQQNAAEQERLARMSPEERAAKEERDRMIIQLSKEVMKRQGLLDADDDTDDLPF
jgi:hypothetical protein